jgi:peptidoglycan/LPS O-acetylase OafA/YrhL
MTIRLNKNDQLAARTSVHLDLIRGVAALAVMFGHLRGLFFITFPFISHKSLVISVLYAVTGYGHEAVMIFFALSGFFIGASVLDSVAKQTWSWRNYLVNRVTRLELVLFPALLLGLLWDQIGMRVPQAAALYYGGMDNFFLPSVALRSTFPVFFGNMFFLQSILSPVFGSNSPLWSISYEFWYYILFPTLALAVLSNASTRRRLLYGGIFLLLIWFVGSQVSLYFPIWLAGALVGRLRRVTGSISRGAQLLLSAGAGLIFIGVLAWGRMHRLSSGISSDYLVGFAFALFLFAVVLGSRNDVSSAYAHITKKLSGFSYTLYLVHFPVLLLLYGLLEPTGKWQPDPLHLLYALGIVFLILVYSYGVAEFTEARTAIVRHRLIQLWMPRARDMG